MIKQPFLLILRKKVNQDIHLKKKERKEESTSKKFDPICTMFAFLQLQLFHHFSRT